MRKKKRLCAKDRTPYAYSQRGYAINLLIYEIQPLIYTTDFYIYDIRYAINLLIYEIQPLIYTTDLCIYDMRYAIDLLI
jgi:hypothetical protein